MTVVISDNAVLSVLGQVREKAEIRDPNGKLLGNFEPHVETEDEMYERLKKLFDPAEFHRRFEEEKDKGYTIEQVMEYIYSQEPGK